MLTLKNKIDQHKVKKDGHADTRMSVRDVLLVKGMYIKCRAVTVPLILFRFDSVRFSNKNRGFGSVRFLVVLVSRVYHLTQLMVIWLVKETH